MENTAALAKMAVEAAAASMEETAPLACEAREEDETLTVKKRSLVKGMGAKITVVAVVDDAAAAVVRG